MKKIVPVRVVPRAGKSGVETSGNGSFKVRVSAAPEKGKANKEVIKALADHFGIPRSRIRIIRGGTSRDKFIEIDADDPRTPKTAA